MCRILLHLAVVLCDHQSVLGALSTDDQLRLWKEYGGNAVGDLVVIPHLTDPDPKALEAMKTALSFGHRDLPFSDLELKDEGLYACGKNGHMSLQNTFVYPHYEMRSSLEESNFRIKYQFTVPKINYDFYVHYQSILIPDLKDNIAIEYSNAEAELNGYLDVSSELVKNVVNRECILRFKDIKVISMDSPQVLFKSLGSVHKRLTVSKLNYLVSLKVDRFIEDFEMNLKIALYLTLVKSGKWVCQEEDVKEFLNKKMGEVGKKTGSSADFKKYCGNN